MALNDKNMALLDEAEELVKSTDLSDVIDDKLDCICNITPEELEKARKKYRKEMFLQKLSVTECELLKFIELLFTSELNANEIANNLYNEYGIKLSEPFLQEVNEMCNLSERIEERALKRGISQGITQGINLQAYDSILNIMSSFNISFDQAVLALKLPDHVIDVCKKKFELES